MSNMNKANSLVLTIFKEKKYRGILFLAGAFLILMITVALSTAYLNDRSKRAVTELDLVAQQNIISRQLSENILNVDIHLNERLNQIRANKNAMAVVKVADLPPEALESIKNLETQKRVFSEIVASLDVDGDTVVLADGRKVVIDGIQSEHLRGYVDNMGKIWAPYDALLASFLKDSKTGTLSKEKSKSLVEYTRNNSQILQKEIADLHFGIADFIQDKTTKVYRVQLAGLLGAFILFLAMIFGALRQLLNNDRLLEAARRETTDIMTTVNTGLFLLDKDLTIGNQYSNALEGIMGTNRLAGENLTTVLRNRISDKDLETARQFVQQLYNPRVKENLVNDLNPLHKIMFRDERASKNRYLDFKFSRVYENKDIVRILVNVNDVSEAVLLEQRLEKEREQNDLQIEMLTTILNVHPQIINEFISNTLVRINKINDVLKNPGSSQFELEGKLKLIYREMHSLKGEASALKLHNFTKIASESEEKMQMLQNKAQLAGNDFLPLAVHLDELLTLANTISKLGERINSGSANTSLTSKPAQATALTYADFYKNFAREIATRQNKDVHINVKEVQLTEVPDHVANTVKEMSIQLLRNAIVHGIESAETRTANGKNATGLINLSVIKEGQNLVLTVQDDGKGIDYATIRLQLVTKGLYTTEQAKELTEGQLLQHVFTSGFSTKQKVDEDGGRGVGLDIIKERLSEFNGQIDVKSKFNKGTQFVITLPLTSK
ncbi:ATP-binding protein [Moraxella sp. ZY210820]|uniref:ATP-binding protein n=1 Tax=unclassified Moraxella TaxID=2685852 RepID=UPI0027305C0D|nr:ATP-binding protein [Moraxella sp. ZY210820]WLF84061.1 ATP-binding protein [Moraxella sp. ZY210820]